MQLIAIVRVRGIRNVKPKIKKTLELLKLHKPNHAVVYKYSDSLNGMLNVVKDYVTFGEISEETLKGLIQKRGRKGKNRLNKEESDEAFAMFIEKNKWIIDPVFRLRPPRKGWKNIKRYYPFGALGKRDNMDELIKRMM